jgi:poly(A) polymerase
MTPTEQKALRIIQILERAGHEARFVGGCVRDAVMERPIGEVDLATTALPEQVTAILNAAQIRVEPTGIEHGTVTAIVEGTGIEITTLREDIETDGRHAKVTFTKDWAKDAQRRDFTMNALSRDASGKIHDTLGGWQDARDGRVIFAGSPSERIKEDYLRVLRFFRFQATHGRTLPDEAALKACHAAAGHLKDLSRERVWAELKKMLRAPYPYHAWKMMSDAGVGQKILPEAQGARLEKLERAEKVFAGFACDPVLRLAALVHGEPTESETLQTQLALSNKEAKNLSLFLDFSLEDIEPFSAKKTQILAYRHGLEMAGKFMLLSAVLDAQFDWESVASVLQKWEPKTFPLKGDDVVASGVAPGPQVGDFLREVEAWWIDQDFMPDRDACLKKLEKARALKT